MRLSLQEIRQAIRHPDWEVRDMAFRFFQNSFSTDHTVMPALIAAVEQYGWAEACSPFTNFHSLAQTAETVRWLFEQLGRPCPDLDRERYWKCWLRFLSRQLDGAPAELLAPYEGILEGVGGLDPERRHNIQQRLPMAYVGAQTGWAELELYCRESAADYIPIDMCDDELARFTEVIARDGGQFTDQILESLETAEIDDSDDVAFWMRAAATQLAGVLHIDAAVPFLVARMDDDIENGGDWYCHRCVDALIRMGTDHVIQAVAERWEDEASRDFRALSSRVFEGIRSELAVETGLALMAKESDETIRRYLADSLLFQFDSRAIEPVRLLILKGLVDEGEELMIRRLVANCTLLGARLPELDPWRERAERTLANERRAREDSLDEEGRLSDDFDAEFEEMERRLDSYLEDAEDLDDDLDDGDLDEYDDEYEDEPIFNPLVDEKDPPSTIMHAGPRVGRNDPCPCGSGKKYKKCCMTRERNPPPIEW